VHAYSLQKGIDAGERVRVRNPKYLVSPVINRSL